MPRAPRKKSKSGIYHIILRGTKEYKWSSYKEYIEGKGIVDREYAFAMFSDNDTIALKAFIDFTNESNDDKCLEIEEVQRKLTDDTLRAIIEDTLKIKVIMIQNKPREEMKEILKKILEFKGVSTRQLSRVTGIPANTIWRL